jgi:hypothetical protein
LSTAAVLLDIEKAFDTTWHLGLLYKLSDLKFSVNLTKPSSPSQMMLHKDYDRKGSIEKSLILILKELGVKKN